MKQTLKQLLELQQASLQSLADLLNQEKVAIVNRNALEIEQIIKEKQEMMAIISQYNDLVSHHKDYCFLEQKTEYKQMTNAINLLIQQCREIDKFNDDFLQRTHLCFHKTNNLFQQSQNNKK